MLYWKESVGGTPMSKQESWSAKVNRKLNKKLQVIDVAAGRRKADLVLKNATYVNVFSGELATGDIAVCQGLVVGMGTYEGIEEVDGVIKFKYKGGVENPDTAIEDVEKTADIIAIYNILGQKQTTTDIEVLTTGTYIVVTSSGSYKMVR